MRVPRPIERFRDRCKLLINGRARKESQFRVVSCAAYQEIGRLIGRIGLPVNAALIVQDRKPSETLVCTNRVINESILTIAPGAKRHAGFRICIDDSMRPTRRHDDLVSQHLRSPLNSGRDCCRRFLRIDDRFPFPNLKQFRSRPSTMRRDGVNMSLAANRLFSELASGINDNAK